MFIATPYGTTGPDGQFRICDLAPGSYRLSAMDRPGGGALNAELRSFAVTAVTIADRETERLLRSKIEEAFPDDAILGEEEG